MANKGKYTGTAASAIAVAADDNREYLVIQKVNATALAFGFGGEAAVADEGIILDAAGESVRLEGHVARSAVYAIGNGGTMTWHAGNIKLNAV